jgi:hypothetical protein
MTQLLFRHLDHLATDRWARQGVRRLLRAAWLAACIWCIGLGGHLLWGWPLRLDLLGALALAVIGVAVLLLLRPKLSPLEAARRLDRRFHLDEQLATAVEIAATRPPPGSIGARLVAQATHTTSVLQARIARRQRAPWNEALTLAALVLAALGLYLLVGIGRVDLQAAAAPVPPLVSPQDPAQQFAAEPPAQGDPSQALVPGPGDQAVAGDAGVSANAARAAGDPRTLEALADALRDHGATRPAAEALDRGDVAGAAQELRALADQADQLSEATRDDLATSLREAAERIAPNDPALADQLRRSADGLERGGEDAQQALDDLASAIERLQDNQQAANTDSQDSGQQPGAQQGQGQQSAQDQSSQSQSDQAGQRQGEQQGQGAGSGASAGPPGEQRQADPSQRLGVEGEPVPLEANGEGQVPAEPSDRPPTTSAPVPGFTQGGSGGERVRVGADPLRIPIDERDVVQEYFAP